jgi:hypothetical protein
MAIQSEVLEAALNELRKRREQLDRAIEGLEMELGISSGTPTSTAQSEQNSVVSRSGEGADVLSKVYQGQFFGKSQTQAARELLNMVRRPLKTPILSDALSKSGMKVNISSLYTAFKRSPDFVLVLPNTWGVKEWYPDGVKSLTVEKRPKRRDRKRKTSHKPETVSTTARDEQQAEAKGDRIKK